MISYLKREVYRWLIKGILKKMEKFMGLIFIIVKKGMVSKRFEAGIIWLVVGMMLLAVFLYALFPENLSITGKAGSDFSDVTFGTVNVDYVSNIAPRLGDIEDSILICEDSFLNYSFDASDVEENQIITVDINPKGLFYVNPITFINDKQTFAESYIISKDFVKVDVGSRIYTLSVSDQKYVDTKIVNITIVEVNNPPVVSEIGAQTVWINGSNTTFYKEIDVNDVESGDRTSGDLTFDLTFLDGDQFFDITNDGVMSFVADESLIGFYNISVCVSDVGLDVTSANIDLCGQDGLSQTVCKNFSLAVTLNNRAPTIVSHYPDSVGSFAGTTGLYLNTTYMDPDGNIPDARWYIDGALKQLETGSLNSEFSYIFGCDVSGIHTAELIVGDGNLNDSVFWSFEVAKIDCPESMILAGSEKKSIGARCVVDWICNDWNVCQNIQTSLDLNIISSIDYRKSIDACKNNGLSDEICGIHIRNCFDLNSCNVTKGIPNEFQSCYFTESPGCFDGVKNCHGGKCELLVDCGGSCHACATCSDDVKNQGEEGIDCGDLCSRKCIEVIPFIKKYFGKMVLIILGFLIIFTIFRVMKITKLRKELARKPRKKKDE